MRQKGQWMGQRGKLKGQKVFDTKHRGKGHRKKGQRQK